MRSSSPDEPVGQNESLGLYETIGPDGQHEPIGPLGLVGPIWPQQQLVGAIFSPEASESFEPDFRRMNRGRNFQRKFSENRFPGFSRNRRRLRLRRSGRRLVEVRIEPQKAEVARVHRKRCRRWLGFDACRRLWVDTSDVIVVVVFLQSSHLLNGREADLHYNRLAHQRTRRRRCRWRRRRRRWQRRHLVFEFSRPFRHQLLFFQNSLDVSLKVVRSLGWSDSFRKKKLKTKIINWTKINLKK